MAVFQGAIERKNIGITLKDHKPNKTIIRDITRRIEEMKLDQPRISLIGREKWPDGHHGEKIRIDRITEGLNWYKVVQNRETRKKIREAYILKIEEC